MKINEQIALLRKRKGITQGALADALGVSNQAVSKWEASLCCPDITLLPDIAKYFGVSVDYLLGCTPTESKASALPEGNIVYCENGLFISCGKIYKSPDLIEQYQILMNLEKLLKPNVLRTMYALYDLTVNDFCTFVTAYELSQRTNLKQEEIELAIKELPTEKRENESGTSYRLDGSFMHVPSILKLIRYC